MSGLGMGGYLLESDRLMFEGVLAELLSILCEFQVHTPGQKAKAKKMRFWKIYGYNGLTKIYGRELKTGCFSEKEIQTVLQCDGSRGSVIALCWLAVFGAGTSVTVGVEVLS